jgi:4-amino-4-deoxy-L-arabinose transferase-like glycosyltransferase
MSGSVVSERPPRLFTVPLGLIAAFGLTVRIAYVEKATGILAGDGLYYHAIAALVADGKGFIAPKPYLATGQVIASAPHPPAWPLVLSAAAFAGLRTTLEQQLIACAIGTATVVLVGFAARRLAGNFAGLVAAGIAAVYPNFWLYERELMSEPLTLFGAALTILLAYRFRDRPTRGRAVAVGFSCGLLAITHAEQMLLVGVLLVPLILLARDEPLRRRLCWAMLATTAAAAMILPWAAYNTARFHSPVLLGNEFGVTVAISNCPFTYSGKNIGFQDLRCRSAKVLAGRITGGDEPTVDNQFLRVGVDYAREHISRVPVVVAVREARVWSLYPQQLRVDVGRRTGRHIIEVGFVMYWMLVPAAVAGVVILRRRRVIVFPLIALFVTVSVGVALTYGFTRFRAAAEVAIVLLAAVALDAVFRRLFPSYFARDRQHRPDVGEAARLSTAGSTRDRGGGPSRRE